MRDIWTGWLQFGLGGTGHQIYFALDLLLTAVIAFLVLRFINTRRGFAYITTLVGSVILLAITANLTLPALHFLSQILIIVLLVGLPLFFEEKWLALFSRGTAAYPAATEKGYLNPVLLGVLAILIGFVGAGLSNGPGVKTAELPEGVAVSAVNLKTGISANFGSQKRITIIVQAPRSVWNNLKSEDFSATADVQSLAEGTHEVNVAVTSKKTDIRVIRTKPTRVTVTLEPVIRKTVGVVARFSGKAGNDLIPDEPVFTPEKVELTGPKSIVEDISQAVIQVKLDGLTQAIDQKFQLVALNSAGEPIEDVTFTPPDVSAKVALVKAGKLKTVGIKVKVTGQPASGFWLEGVSTTPPTIVVTGSADALDKLTFVETDTVSVAGLNSDSDTTTTLALPPGIVSAESVSKIAVKFKISPATTTKAITPTISYDGVDASLKVTTIDPTTINTVVSGTSAVLAALNGNDVIIKLNLSAYKSAGTYAVTIKTDFFSLKDGVSLVSFLPSVINVTLESK